jgi:type IV pilus assembly protein PilM
MANKMFSLELNELQTKMAHLEVDKGKIQLLSLGFDTTIPNYFTNPNEKSADDQAKVIVQLHKQLNIDTKRVHIVIPDAMSYFQLMVMPKLKEDDLAKSIRLQMEEFVPYPVSDINMDFEVVQDLPENKVLLLFIAIQKKIADHVGLTMDKAELEPVSLEIDTTAMGRFFFEFQTYFREPCVVVDIGYSSSTIYIVNPAVPYFSYIRTVKIGLQHFIRDVKMNLNLDDAKSLEALRSIGLKNNASVKLYPIIYPLVTEFINEINRTLLLAKEKYNGTIKKIYFFNNDTQIANLALTVQTITSVPVQSINLTPLLVANPITQSFQNNLSAFLPVIAAHIR